MITLAFDPGFGRTGWGVITKEKNTSKVEAIAWGVIETKNSMEHCVRLHTIYMKSKELLLKYKPDTVCVESLFLHNNKTTVAGVYQSQGVIFAACGQGNITPMQISPTQIKKGVTGSGRANKKDVTLMVQKILGITQKITPDDASDALAGAIVGMQMAKIQNSMQTRAIL